MPAATVSVRQLVRVVEKQRTVLGTVTIHGGIDPCLLESVDGECVRQACAMLAGNDQRRRSAG